MRRFNILVLDSDLDALIRACRYGMSSVSKLEIESGEAAKIEYSLKRILKQVEAKKQSSKRNG